MYFDYNFEPRGDYLCIDCKSFYASVECVARGLNPLTAMLVVLSGADRPGGLVLASSPLLKEFLEYRTLHENLNCLTTLIYFKFHHGWACISKQI